MSGSIWPQLYDGVDRDRTGRSVRHHSGETRSGLVDAPTFVITARLGEGSKQGR
jgi:hypothetical protein